MFKPFTSAPKAAPAIHTPGVVLRDTANPRQDPLSTMTHGSALAGDREAPPPSPGARATSQRLLQQCLRHKTHVSNIHSLSDRMINTIAEAFGHASEHSDNEIRRNEVFRVFQKVQSHVWRTGPTRYCDHTASQLQAYFPRLTDEDAQALQQAMATAHIDIGMTDAAGGHSMSIFFGGTQNFTDFVEDLRTMSDANTGAVYQATAKAAEIFAKILDDPQARPRLEVLSGFSMGGGTAQYFKAALESRLELETKPALLLFDPQLLSEKQKQEAIKDAPLGYDFTQLHGVAITLDYDKNPKTNLMGHMKNFGYSPEGLVELGLSLKPRAYVTEGSSVGQRGMPCELEEPFGLLLGYHKDFSLFRPALRHFLADHTAMPPAPPPSPEATD